MAIHQAINSGRLNQTRLLLNIGVGVNAKNVKGQTPLITACLHKQEDIAVKMVKLLLRRCADKSLTDKRKRNAFSYVCELGRETIVTLLLKDLDFDLNEQDLDGNTPLMYAAVNGNAKIVRLLIGKFEKYRMNIDTRNHKGFTAYLLASKSGNFYSAHLLRTEGCASDSARDSEFFRNAIEWSLQGTSGKETKQREFITTETRPKTSPAPRILKQRASMSPLRTRSLTSPNLLLVQRPSLRARSLTFSRVNSSPLTLHSTIIEEPVVEEERRDSELIEVNSLSREGDTTLEQTSPKRGKVLDLHKLMSFYERPSSGSFIGKDNVPSNYLSVPSCHSIYKDR